MGIFINIDKIIIYKEILIMRKTLVIALILVSVCVSKPFEGYMVNYDKTGAIKF